MKASRNILILRRCLFGIALLILTSTAYFTFLKLATNQYTIRRGSAETGAKRFCELILMKDIDSARSLCSPELSACDIQTFISEIEHSMKSSDIHEICNYEIEVILQSCQTDYFLNRNPYEFSVQIRFTSDAVDSSSVLSILVVDANRAPARIVRLIPPN